jgi:hypothetical protein
MRFRGGRRLASNLNEDPYETGTVFHAYFIGEPPCRILQKGVGKLEGSDRDVTFAICYSQATHWSA